MAEQVCERCNEVHAEIKRLRAVAFEVAREAEAKGRREAFEEAAQICRELSEGRGSYEVQRGWNGTSMKAGMDKCAEAIRAKAAEPRTAGEKGSES
jgi:hypothetical protein